MPSPNDRLSAAKTAKEIAKLQLEIDAAHKNLTLEYIKASASLLAPIMAAATVLGTVYMGYLQVTAKSASDEDSSWRQTIDLIDKARPEDFSSRHVGTLLKPFLESRRYKALAIGVTVDELPKIRDVGTFNTMFSAAFPSPGAADLPILLDLDRKLNDVIASLRPTDSPDKDSKRAEQSVVIKETAVLCDPIANVLRSYSHRQLINDFFPNGKNSNASLPLNGIFFERCDFHNVDFSDIDITGSVFDYVILDGTVLRNISERRPILWLREIWWTAEYIDKPLLLTLLKDFKPYQGPPGETVVYRDYAVISAASWTQNIRRLCANAHMVCTDEQIRAAFPN